MASDSVSRRYSPGEAGVAARCPWGRSWVAGGPPLCGQPCEYLDPRWLAEAVSTPAESTGEAGFMLLGHDCCFVYFEEYR